MHIKYNSTSKYWEYLSDAGPPEVWSQLSLTASVITEGVLATARLGTGTPDGTKFLRDDSTWQSITGSVWSISGSDAYRSSGKISVGTSTISAVGSFLGTGEQLRLSYDSSNYSSFTVGSSGTITLSPTGTNPNIVLTPSGTGWARLNGNVGIGIDPTVLVHIHGTDGSTIKFDGGATQIIDLMTNDIQIRLGYLTAENDPKIMWYAGGPGGTDVTNWDCSLACIGRTWAGQGRGYLRLRAEHFEIVSNYNSSEYGAVAQSLKFRDYAGSSVIQHESGGTIAFATDNSNLDPTSLTNIRMKIGSTLGTGTVYSSVSELTSTDPSSIEYKDNIIDIKLGYKQLLKLKPKQFNWKHDNSQDFGYIAEEIRELLPELYLNDGRTKGYKSAKLIFYAIEMLKDHESRLNKGNL